MTISDAQYRITYQQYGEWRSALRSDYDTAMQAVCDLMNADDDDEFSGWPHTLHSGSDLIYANHGSEASSWCLLFEAQEWQRTRVKERQRWWFDGVEPIASGDSHAP